MKRHLPIAALAAALLVLGLSARAEAWGARHVGYTHVGPSGVQHYGRNVVSTPSGVYGGGHSSAYGAYGGAYHSDYRYGATRAYTPTYGGGYAAGGYHYGGVYAYPAPAGVYRYP